MVVSLPIRNWNLYVAYKPYLAVLVVSLPIRNWNYFGFNENVVAFDSFEKSIKEYYKEFVNYLKEHGDI